MAVPGLIPGTIDLGISEGGGGLFGSIVRTLIPSITSAPANSAVYNTDPTTGQQKLYNPPGSYGAPEFGQVAGTTDYSNLQTKLPQDQTPQPQAPQPQPVRSVEGMPSWVRPGDEFSVGNGVYRMKGDGSLEFLGTHEQRAAAAQAQEESMINAIYNPAFSALDQQARDYAAMQPGQEQLIEGQAARGVEGVRSQEAEAQTALGKQETATRTAESNAYQQARQLYNELAQRYGAMFGSRTSAGPFAMEILGRETQKRFGDVQQTAQQGIQAVTEEKNKLKTWVNTQLNEWDRKKTEALTNLRGQFTQALAQINAQRGALESQKARDRYSAMVDAQNRQVAIEQADRQFKQQLALFQAQKESQLTTVPEFAYGTGGYDAASALGRPFSVSTIGPNATIPGSSNFAPTTGTYTWEYDPATGEKRKVPSYVVG